MLRSVRSVARRLALLAGAAALVVAVAAPARAEDLLEKVRKQGSIMIGTSNDAPVSYIDPKTKEPAGVLPDILAEFFKREGMKVAIKITAMPFASLIPSVQSGRIDLMGDAMYIRPERQKVMDFTDVIFYNPASLDVAKGNPKHIKTLADLCGLAAGTYQGTVYVDMLKKASAACPAGKSIDLHLYPTIQNAFADLSAGRIDAAVIDGSLSAYAIKENPALNFELLPGPEEKATTACAFAVSKGNPEFIAAFNKQLAAMKADGTLAKLFEKWSLTPTDFFLKL